MPLLDSEVDQNSSMDVEDAFRPRAGSAGLKDFIFRRSRHKSSEVPGGGGGVNSPVNQRKHLNLNVSNASSSPPVASKKSPSPPVTRQPPGQPPTTPTTKVKNFFSAIRPRSKSDAASMQPNHGRPRSKTLDQEERIQNSKVGHGSPHSNHMMDPNQVSLKSPPGGTTSTPMSQIQAGHLHSSVSGLPGNQDSSGNALNPQEFVEAYRQRAYTDPKAKARAAAVAKYRQKKLVGLSGLIY